MKYNFYDVFDREGNKIIEYATSKEISAQLDVPLKRVTKCGCNGQWLCGKYQIVKVGEAVRTEEDNCVNTFLLEEWDKVRAMFKNVVWVKEYKYGVKKLGVKKVG